MARNSHLTLLLSFSVMLPLMVESRIRHFKWEVNYLPWSPDCSAESLLIAINGHFPGPTIDTIVVELHNMLPSEGVFESPWADGTASISQCAINPGETFIYEFQVDKAGTYFYHGHYGMQRSAGLYGSLIVEVAEGKQKPFHFNAELSLLLSDWWHQSIYQQVLDFNSQPFRWIGKPQSLLIEAKGRYNCSLKTYEEDKNKPCYVLQVEPNKTYRLRIASVTTLASLNSAIENHKLVLVEADGNYIQPVTVENLDIYSGETYSLLLHTNQDPSTKYKASASIISRPPKMPPGLAILHYQRNPSSLLPRSAPPTPLKWIDTAAPLPSLARSLPIPSGTPRLQHRRIVLLNTQNKINGYTKWAINNDFPKNYDIFQPPQNPNTTTGEAVYRLKLGSTVDVILQKANVLEEGTSEVHLWHLHGHDFWTFHCHIEPHLHMGMGVVIAEGIDRVRIVPQDALCGRMTKRLIRPIGP
ncbi:hypothetical protein AMTRI_Chr05g70100 [Amborella trichopoda]